MYKQGPLHRHREHSVATENGHHKICKTEQGIDNKGEREGYSNSSSKGQKNK